MTQSQCLPLLKLNGDNYFSKFNLSKGYWQVTIPEEDIQKTAFVTPDGSYEFLKMPFGMVNSAATFMYGMKKLLVDMNGVDYYWDDILAQSPTWEEHIEALTQLFKRLAQANVIIRSSKCIFGAEDEDDKFLGHQLREGLIGLHDDNVSKIKIAPRPTNKRHVRSFMGLTAYYINLIPTITAPLSDLTQKGQPSQVEWNDVQEKAYQTIKTPLASEPRPPARFQVNLLSQNRCFSLRCWSSSNTRTRR